MVADRDVSRAFKRRRVRYEGVAEFGASLPGDAAGMGSQVIMSRCAMVFGWAGSQGEYVSFARAAKWAHGRRRPPLPRVNGTARFARMWPMDDGIILERRVGLRPWLAAEERDAAMRQAWGPEAVHVELGEEGASREEQLVRGLHLDASARRIWLPEPKCAKAADLLALPELRF